MKRWADRLGVSPVEAVRRCVAERLDREQGAAGRAQRVQEAAGAVGTYAAGRSDLARRHDDHLDDAFGTCLCIVPLLRVQ